MDDAVLFVLCCIVNLSRWEVVEYASTEVEPRTQDNRTQLMDLNINLTNIPHFSA